MIRNMQGYKLLIDSNLIDSVKYEIYMYNNQGIGTNKKITNNKIRECEYGIYVSSNDNVFSLRVWENRFFGGYYSISFLNNRRANVQDNYINFDYSSLPYGITPIGIYAGNSRYATIKGNYIDYYGSSSWKPIGIYTDLSPNAYIECNRMYNQYDGIVCKGNMPNSTLKMNLMHGCNYGMYMNSATIGDQLSDSTQTDNRWVNIGTYKMSGGFNAQTNWWYYNGNSEYSVYPYGFTSNFTAFPTTNLPSSCGGGAATSTGGGSSLSNVLNSTTSYDDNISENQYYEQVYKYDLYKENISVVGSASNVSFNAYQSIMQSNIDEFYTLKKQIADNDFLTASNTANAITTSNIIEKSLLKVYDVQIAQGKDQRQYNTTSEYNMLMDIANESTLETGYAVFEACGMLGVHPVIEYHMEAKTRSSQVEDKDNTAYVYPNPTNNNISIAISCKSSSEISIFDINGKLMLRKKLPSGIFIENMVLDNFSEGCYLIFIFDEQRNCIMRDKLLIVR